MDDDKLDKMIKKSFLNESEKELLENLLILNIIDKDYNEGGLLELAVNNDNEDAIIILKNFGADLSINDNVCLKLAMQKPNYKIGKLLYNDSIDIHKYKYHYSYNNMLNLKKLI